MAEQQTQPVEFMNADVNTRINEIEEKQRLLKDRLLLVGENLISTKEEQEKENLEFKTRLKNMENEIRELKQLNKRIIDELNNFARKTEVSILEKQFQMFEPLKTARLTDVEKIVRQEISKLKRR